MWKTITLTIFWISFQKSAENHCGKSVGLASSSGTREDRIVGGYDMGYYKYPWYVALVKNKIVGCGGALVNSKTILTAAHCFRSIERAKLEEYYTIRLGVYNICMTESTQTDFKAEKVFVHELYAKKNPYYDIALITLNHEAAQFLPICMPSRPITNRPREGLVPGLGVLKYEGATPCTLHESRLLIHPDEECKAMLNTVEKNVSHIIKAFCAGYMQGGIDTCQGDSGGPLQIVDSNGDYTLLGIVSFGYKCAAPGVLGLYTDVSQHLDWIKKHAVGGLFHDNDSGQTTTNQVDLISTPETVSEQPQKPPLATIPLPSIGMNPAPHLQFFPVRPVNLKPQRSPVNIFIFNRRNDNHHTKLQTESSVIDHKKQYSRRNY